MNKNTKIWLNYIAGGAISLLLLWNIYGLVLKQAPDMNIILRGEHGPAILLYLCIALMFINTSLESYKWYMLARSVAPLSYPRAFASYLTGVAFSIITPNRIGEYPARVLYLSRHDGFRYINVSVLGVMSQLSAVYIFGFAGLVYYNFTFPSVIAKTALCACLLANICLMFVYWRFEAWLSALERVKWLRKFAVYGRLLNRMTTARQVTILGISLLRFCIFTAQYLFLLRWMNVDVPLIDGFFMAALFFWVMAVIPSVTLAELGIRGTVSVYLFQHFSANTVGMLAATVSLWLLNLIVPSVTGSILALRMKLLSLTYKGLTEAKED